MCKAVFICRALVLLAVMLCPLSSHSAELIPLGILPGYDRCDATAVSSDGLTVVGHCQLTTWRTVYQPFRWRLEDDNGLVGLGFLFADGYESRASDVSGDGSVVVGSSYVPNSGGFWRGWRWTEVSGIEEIDYRTFHARAITDDGSTIVGYRYYTNSGGGVSAGGFSWTELGGYADIPIADAVDISADGTLVVGPGGGSVPRAQRLDTTTNAITELGAWTVTAVSPDGTVIVGREHTNTVWTRPYQWGANGTGSLTSLWCSNKGSAAAASQDGAIIVGNHPRICSLGEKAFIWTTTDGFEYGDDWLQSIGVDISAIVLDSAGYPNLSFSDVASNRTSIVGSATIGGVNQPILVDLSTDECRYPGDREPSTASLATGQDNYCEDWAGVDQTGTDLLAANLSWTDLRGAILSSANLTGADLSFATLTGAFYDENTIFPSGNTYDVAPSGLDGDQHPWEADMIPAPEPGFGSMLAIGLGGLVGLRARGRNATGYKQPLAGCLQGVV